MKLQQLGKGLFLVRFSTHENCDEVVNGGHIFFDSKPLIVKKWDPDMELQKEDIHAVPIWTKFP